MQAHEGQDRVWFRFMIDLLRLRWKLIAGVLALVVGLVMAWSLTRPPVYRASAELLIEPTVQDALGDRGTQIDAEYIATQVNVVSSQAVAEAVQADLGLDEPPDLANDLRVEPVGQSHVIRVTAESGDAQEAADLAQAVAVAYLDNRAESARSTYDKVLKTLTAQQDNLSTRVAQIDKRLAGNPPNAVALNAERSRLIGQLSQVTTSLSDLSAADSGGSGGEILQPAQVPTSPSSPNHLVNLLLGLVIGLMFGVGAALLRDRLDDVVHDADGLRTVIGHRPLLARIPHWDDTRFNQRLATVLEPRSAPAEAFTGLAVEVRFLLSTREPRKTAPTVLILSTVSNESKTTVAGNLAVAMANLGMEVVALDADLRRGDLSERFGLPGGIPGLADRLLADPSLEPIDAGIRGLRVLGRGRSPANPTELLASAQLRDLLVDLKDRADVVVVDAPPALVADGLGMLDVADVVVVATRVGVTRRHDLSSLLHRLGQMRASAVGVAVSDDRSAQLTHGGYYHSEA